MDAEQIDYLAFSAPAILADWMDEHDQPITAAWLREAGMNPPRVTTFRGDGDGYGDDGDGDGYGYGYGYDGYGYGDGYGDGDGDGYGYGYGGYGYGDGYGDGDGDGDGYGEIKTLPNNQETEMPARGQYVVVRSRDQGCMFGQYEGHCGREVRLLNARQIYSWAGNRLTLADFAVKTGTVRLSATVPGETVMLEACGIIPTTVEVTEFLKTHS